MKKLIFCFDGTCNDPQDAGDFFEDSSISNVLKLHAFFGGKLSPLNEKNATISSQHSLYYSGVGTRGNWLQQKWNSAFAPADGDMEHIIDDAKKDLNEHYNDGDKIYVFGFSRGAAIARMFASKCAQDIEFLGVFDTVAATKGSRDFDAHTFPASGILFENGTMGGHIKKAVHLVAIDEKRLMFQPTLFNKDDRILEVWFSGVHSDIGGGYWFDGLSDITLQFMIDSIKGDLTILADNELNYAGLTITDSKDSICWDDLNVKPLSFGTLHEQKRSGIKAEKTLAPRLVRVSENDVTSSTLYPIIHHTVRERFNKVAAYRPYALRNCKFKIIDAQGNIGEDVYHGISEL